jgi:hypothetical protein
MIQIGVQLPSAASTEGPPPDLVPAIGSDRGPESPSTDDPSGQPQGDVLFVSPPPLPFPRVFPGL